MRYALILQYNGTNYHGWQKQPNASSVQQSLETALSDILRAEINVYGCGRTDTGVHARDYVASFVYAAEMCSEDMAYLKRKLNAYLPYDIRILSLVQVPEDFSARFDALSRTYCYYISTVKQPFDDEFSWFVPVQLDIRKMNTAAKMLYQFDDFTSFSKLHTQVNNNNCRILYARWERRKDYLVFTVRANRFLRNMVRSIVGTLVEVGRGKITADEFYSIIESKNRCNAGASVPAKGLFLENIEYPSDIERILRRFNY